MTHLTNHPKSETHRQRSIRNDKKAFLPDEHLFKIFRNSRNQKFYRGSRFLRFHQISQYSDITQ